MKTIKESIDARLGGMRAREEILRVREKRSRPVGAHNYAAICILVSGTISVLAVNAVQEQHEFYWRHISPDTLAVVGRAG